MLIIAALYWYVYCCYLKLPMILIIFDRHTKKPDLATYPGLNKKAWPHFWLYLWLGVTSTKFFCLLIYLNPSIFFTFLFYFIDVYSINTYEKSNKMLFSVFTVNVLLKEIHVHEIVYATNMIDWLSYLWPSLLRVKEFCIFNIWIGQYVFFNCLSKFKSQIPIYKRVTEVGILCFVNIARSLLKLTYMYVLYWYIKIQSYVAFCCW